MTPASRRRKDPPLTRLPLAALLPLCLSGPVSADEGMWTFNQFPSAKVRAKYSFEPSKEWLAHVQRSAVRLARGCSGSLVSPTGLVMTNHHCAEGCIEQISSAKHDYETTGFWAKTGKDEVRCPDFEVNQLLDISDVTARVTAATKGLADQAFNAAQKAEMTRIEKECASGDEVRCDVVTLYHGGQYHLYRYRRFQDVRLVFAPELATAYFGGDPDNFMFPRYDLDVSFLRIYEKGEPAKLDDYLRWSKAGAHDGELTFVAGNPGGTERLLTVAQLELERDVTFPASLVRLAELRGMLTEFQHRGPEQKRFSNPTLLYVENGFKATKGRFEALLDKKLIAQKVDAEKVLRAKVDVDPALKPLYGGAWNAIATALERYKPLRNPHLQVEQGRGFTSDLFKLARLLVRSADELPKPNDQRLREYTDGKLPGLKQQLFSAAPIYPEFEIATLTFSLTKLRETMGPDDPLVKKVLGRQSPAELAAKLVGATRLRDVKVRQALFDGGAKAVAASTDAMVEFARLIDPDARALRKEYEDEVEAPLKKNGELIAQAMFKVYGTSSYPDATFTPRLSYGQVKGWVELGKEVKPVTTFAGAFERDTGRDPFALPKSWLAAKAKLDLTTPFNFCTDNDIIGGNSGSPVVNSAGEVVGLVFDGNLESLGGSFGFDASVNRAVAVHSAALTEALGKVYGAGRLVDELTLPAK